MESFKKGHFNNNQMNTILSMNRTGNLNFRFNENKVQSTTMTSGFFNRTSPKFITSPSIIKE
jgi:hypothetical protein